MLQLGFTILTLVMGVLVESFPVAQADPGHHQVCLQAAMADDGRFVVAWVDSLQLPDHYEMDMFIRFFDKDGVPLTDAYRLAELTDTTSWVYYPRLDMNSAGNAVLVWLNDRTQSDLLLSNIRFQAFNPDGTPRDSAKTLYAKINVEVPTPVSLANNGVFVMGFGARLGDSAGIWVQRFDLDGIPVNTPFLAHDSLPDTIPGNYCYPQVALNDAGDVVVTWLHSIETAKNYPLFQVFDANDESVLPWEPFGHPLDDGDSVAGACRPEPHWFDDDRFMVFWSDYTAPRPTAAFPFLGRVFRYGGYVRHPIKTVIWGDTLWSMGSDPRGQFCTAVSSDERFAYTHTRTHYDFPDTTEPWKMRTWEHGAGILGAVVDNEPWRKTTLFEYTPSLGADTINSFWDNRPHVQAPAVACCNDRIVWVYTRLNTDTIFEAYVLISDWDMGEGVTEQPVVSEPTNWEVASAVGPEIVLRYSDCPEGFHAAIYDAAGRKVSEIHNANASGTITWPVTHQFGAGVYFIRSVTGNAPATKVILTR